MIYAYMSFTLCVPSVRFLYAYCEFPTFSIFIFLFNGNCVRLKLRCKKIEMSARADLGLG